MMRDMADDPAPTANFEQAASDDTKPHMLTFDDGTEFRCEPSLPGILILEFFAARNDTSAQAAKSVEVLYAAITEDEHERFDKYLRSRAAPDYTVLTDKTVELLIHYTARPTQPPST